MDVRVVPGGDASRLQMTGRFTFADYKIFRQAVGAALSGTGSRIVLDLSGLEYIDSSALGMMLLARDEAERSDMSVALSGPQGQVRRILEVARFETLFPIEE